MGPLLLKEEKKSTTSCSMCIVYTYTDAPKSKNEKDQKKCFFQCSIVVIVRPKRVADAKAHIDFWEKQLTRKQRYYIYF